jgi:hypothetical protein
MAKIVQMIVTPSEAKRLLMNAKTVMRYLVKPSLKENKS